MHSIHIVKAPSYYVTAAFTDGVLSFNILEGETFADLASRLDQLAKHHTGLPTAIYLKSARLGQVNSAFPAGN